MAEQETEVIKLKSQDDQLFEVEKEIAYRSQTVKDLCVEVEGSVTKEIIPLTSVKGEILAKVIEFCKFHAKADKEKKTSGEDPDEDEDDEEDDYDLDLEKPKEAEDEIKKWNKEFVAVEQHVLFDLMLAANYMNIKDLLDFLIQHVADMIIACKDPAEVRSKFNIPDDLTPEEVEEIKRKNTWAFE